MIELFKLSDLVEISAGQSAPQDTNAFSDDGIPFIRAGSLEFLANGETENKCEKISETNAKKYKLKLYPKNTIIFAKSGMSAKIGRVYRLKQAAYIVSHLAALIPSDDLSPNYLLRWLQKNPPSNLIPNDAYPSLRLSEIANLQVPLPRLKEQKRIAAILDKADALRQKRKESIRLLDEFLRSVFLDMFGDPKINSKNLPKNKLGLMANINMGQSPLGSSYNYEKNGTPLLNGPTEFELKFPKEKQWTTSPTKLSKKGDILFCVRGATAGRMNWSDKQYCIGRGLAAISSKGRLSIKYIYTVLQLHYSLFQNTSNGSTFINISSDRLNSLQIPIPNFQDSNRFETIYKKIENLKAEYKFSELYINTIYSSLVQRAFRGEL